MTDKSRLNSILDAIGAEARRNPQFLTGLEMALNGSRQSGARGPRPQRRAPAPIDPFAALRRGGTEELRAALNALSIDELHDTVAEYRVEPYTLAMKWKTRSRLVDHILATIEQRSRKGNAFRDAPHGHGL